MYNKTKEIEEVKGKNTMDAETILGLYQDNILYILYFLTTNWNQLAFLLYSYLLSLLSLDLLYTVYIYFYG